MQPLHVQRPATGRQVAPEAAEADLTRLVQRLPEVFPGTYSEAFFARSGFTPRVHPIRSMVLGKAGSGRVGIDNVLALRAVTLPGAGDAGPDAGR